MSIQDMGYLNYFGYDCTYVQEGMYYYILPTDSNSNIFGHSQEKDFPIQFSDKLNKKCVAFVHEQSGGIEHVTLKLRYIAKLLRDEEIDSFIMTGNEIDEFFSPLDYYFSSKTQGEYKPSDLLYSQDVVAHYSFSFLKKPVEIDVVYGNVLSEGIRSDLILHPQLIVHIEKTRDLEYIYGVSNVVTAFLQFVHRKKSFNLRNLELYGQIHSKRAHLGYMFSNLYNLDLRSHSRIDASFRCYGTKIQAILSLISDDAKFPISHLQEMVHNPFEYSAERFSALCAAFEHECERNSILYEQKNDNNDILRQRIINYINDISTTDNGEIDFKKNAVNRIESLGRQRGFRGKILNAYKVNADAFKDSLKHILYREKSIEKVSTQLADLRGKVVHKEMGYKFNEQEIEAIRFLEILQFVMTLRRATYTPPEIEMIIGVLYSCNMKYWDKVINNQQLF